MKIGLKLGTWYLSLEVIWIMLFLFCIIGLCSFCKVRRLYIWPLQNYEHKNKCSFFSGFWVFKAPLNAHGSLTTFRNLIYFNKFPSCLASCNDHLGSIFKKKHWMTFWYTWADKITTKEGFLSWMSMIFLQQVLQTLLKRGLGF